MAGVTRRSSFTNSVIYAVTGSGCAVCGRNTGPCIDLGVNVHMEGPLVLCENHARDCGIYAGLVPAEELEKLRDELRAVTERADTAEASAALDLEQAKVERAAAERVFERLVRAKSPGEVVAGSGAKSPKKNAQ